MATLRLEQRMFSKGKQSFELREAEDVLRVATSKAGNSHEYTLPIEIISPDPSRVKRLDHQMLIGAIIFGLLVLGSVWLAVKYHSWETLFITFFLMLPLVGCAYQFRQRSINASVFYNRHSGQSVLMLWDANPSPTVFDEFCKNLSERARRWEKKLNSSQANSAADELRKLGDLHKDGVLSGEEFTQAKARVPAGMGKRSIGFKPE
jgi:hypothetical protein